MNYINEEELKMLKELSTRKGVKGQRMIKDIIWLNTIESQYKVHDIVSYYVDNNLRNGIITEVKYDFTSRIVLYVIESKIVKCVDDNYEEEICKNEVNENAIDGYTYKTDNFVYVNTK